MSYHTCLIAHKKVPKAAKLISCWDSLTNNKANSEKRIFPTHLTEQLCSYLISSLTPH